MSEPQDPKPATLDDILDEVKALRATLEDHIRGIAVCPHGNTGLCAECIGPMLEDISRAVQEITRRA